MKEFANRGALKPIDFATDAVEENYTPDWVTWLRVNGHLYGLVFKGANKSTVWYNVPAFQDAGVTPPRTWTQLLADAKTLKASGVRRTRSAATTAGRSPTSSRTSTCARPAATSTTS